MTSAPFGSSGSDDYFDRHKFNELKKRHDSTANDPRARAAFKKEFESKAAAATKKPTAKPTPSAAKKPTAKPATKAPVAKKPPVAKGKPVPPKGKGGVSDAQASARDKFKEMIAKKKEAAAKKK
jgi:hypothetical protein